jgi:hypothetical protein
MYLVIFTCLNIRAIHLELVPSMSSADFLMAFVRFCNLYGIPKALYSDNASSFLQAGTLLTASSSDNDLYEYLLRNNIKHIRIPLYSAWVGSAWERLIRVVKSCLYKTVGRSRLNYFQFITTLSDIQVSVNSRPLTYRDESDLSQDIISPSSFLLSGSSNSHLIFGDLNREALAPTSREALVETLEKREEVLAKFRDLWYSEYLLSLRQSGKDLYQDSWSDKIRVGDIVLISSPIKPRPLWQMGRVTKLLTGKDGRTRSVELIRPDRSSGIYAISLLYPLELSLNTVESDVPSDFIAPDNRVPVFRSETRQPRRAAERCRERLRNCN